MKALRLVSVMSVALLLSGVAVLLRASSSTRVGVGPALGGSVRGATREASDPLQHAQPARTNEPVQLLAAAKAVHGKPAQSKPASEETLVKAFGSKNAPITMELFSDFQCPACRTLYQNVWHPLMENYVETGKVYLVDRDFPLPAHAYSRLAAQYANAAFRIGKFEKVEDALFANQETWERTGNVDGTVAAVLTPAEMAKVRQLLKTPEVEAAINRDVGLAQANRINQTPTMIITCKGQTYPVTGVVSFTILRQFFDQLLSQK